MINAQKLEKKWYKYKTKGFIMISSILLILGVLIYGGYYVLYKMDFSLKTDSSEVSKISPAPKVINESSNSFEHKNEESSSKTEYKEDLTLKPTIPIVDLESEKLKDEKAKKHVKAKQRQTREKRLVKAKPSSYLTAQELAVMNGKKVTKKINFNKTKSNYMDVMKTKFNQNKNPREALLIAKAYYRSGDYENSEKWALKANKLNRNLDESWLLFAKSQDKLGKQKEALKILVAYYKSSKSSKAKSLIEKIKSKSI